MTTFLSLTLPWMGSFLLQTPQLVLLHLSGVGSSRAQVMLPLADGLGANVRLGWELQSCCKGSVCAQPLVFLNDCVISTLAVQEKYVQSQDKAVEEEVMDL